MDQISINATAGLRTRMQALDIVANNIANAGTSGYKTQNDFHDLFLSSNGAQLPHTKTQWTDQAQGTAVQTDRATDLALSGAGYFAVEGPSGTLLTRNGSFHQLPSGELATPEGYKLRGVDGKPVALLPGVPFQVKPDATVTQNGVEAGRIELVEVEDANGLERMGNSILDPRGAGTLRPAKAQVMQGSLEGSNVSVVESSVRMLSVMRQFESLQKALTINAEMNRKTIEEVARVTAG